MRICAVAMALALAGCSFESEPAVELADNRCVSDAECPQGLCDGNICIDDTNASIEVALEVVGSAPEAQGAIPSSWVFAAERFQGSNVRDLVLPPVREVRGTVRWDGMRVPATLRFTRQMPGAVAPLQALPVEVDTLREPATGEDGDVFDFTAVLVAGETYDVTVLPTSDMVMSPSNASLPAIRSLPPLYLELRVGADGAAPYSFDISFPTNLDASCNVLVRAGCTLEARVVSFDGEVEQPEPGLQVRAVDEASGRVVSSIGETDELGRFAIRLAEDASNYLIRVTSSAGSDPFPAVSADPSVVFDGDPSSDAIYIPRLTPVLFRGRVRDEGGEPVPGATVRFASSGIFDDSELGLRGSFSSSATTEDQGRFEAELLPGFYAVTVTPPEDTEGAWGVFSSEALVGEEVTVVDALVVPTRVQLFGWVRTFNEEAAVGVNVVARARTGPPPAAMHRSQEAVSNSVGRFTMRMDRGLYDIQVRALSQSGYAWLVDPGLSMDTDLARTYFLLPPVPIEGVVQSSDGEVVPNALVRAYVLSSEDGETRQIQVAETVSDSEGNYRLLIAPDLGGE